MEHEIIIFAIVACILDSILWAFLPLWIILLSHLLTIPSLLFIFSDDLPLQLYWNLKSRELRPNLQTEWEKRALVTLRKYKLMAKPVPDLPAEIWERILQCAIEVPYTFDTSCRWKDFHSFVDSRSCLSVEATIPYRRSEQQRKKLQLVCKTWRELLHLHSVRWICKDTNLNQFGKGTLRIDFALSNNNQCSEKPWNIPNSQHLDQLLSLPGTDNHLGVIALRDVVQTDDKLQTVLFSRSSDMPRVASLTYTSCQRESTSLGKTPAPPGLLPGLESSFSSLTCLKISASAVQGSITLPRLEVILINVASYEPGRWWFPSLKHCQMGWSVMHQRTYTPSLIPGPINQMQSILLHQSRMDSVSDYGRIEANDRFWQDHASLRYLGVMNEAFFVTADPPPTHPLSQIYFFESGRLHSGDSFDFDKASFTIRRIPNLKRVTVPTFLNSWSPQQREDMLALYQQGTPRGIEFAHHFGATVSYERRRSFPDIPLFELILGGTIEGMVMTCFIYHKMTGGNELTESLMPHLIGLEIAAVALTLIRPFSSYVLFPKYEIIANAD
ncbi:hypothetical protein CPB86DRAFT_788518 [Serendipita vermifera]|nr:hypothetical protein CPB86DRAFT_788518 [Serendipita vermifera]